MTDANGKDVQKFFIKETGKPADPSSKWYGSYYNTSLTSTWAEYSVEFDFTKTIGSMYSVPLSDAVDADETDLTNFSICFQGDVADKTILIDDVQLELVEDLSEPDPETPTELIKDSDFENADFTKTFDATPVVFGEWVTYTDAKNEKNNISYIVADDAVRGKVGSYTGKPYSWYTSFLHKELKLLLKREFINFLSGVNRQMEVRPRFIFVPRMPVVKMYKNSLLRKLENLLILHQNGMVLFIVQL